MPLKKGLVQVYTGDGKGKTTAAFGLALRAAGHGLKVCIVQFLKSPRARMGEVEALGQLSKNVRVLRFGGGWTPGVRLSSARKDSLRRAVARGFGVARGAVMSKAYDVVVLDEIHNVLLLGLLDEGRVLALLDEKPPEVELVLTGRRASPSIVHRADLVTELRKVKHPFNSGLKARKGIEW